MRTAELLQDQNFRNRRAHQLVWLKRGFWLYFWLIIFEGALRKWIAPGLSGPLLIVRDPVVLFIYWQAYRCRKLSMSTMWPLVLLGFALLFLSCMQLVEAINTIPIALYGLRSYVLHLPLVLIMGTTLDGEDLKKFGRWVLILALPMAMLMVAQFYSGADSWLNNGAGEGASQIGFTAGHVRPSGTFSFVTGPICFFPLVAAFLLNALGHPRGYPRWILWSSAVATVGVIPFSGSRSLLFMICAVVAFGVVSGFSSRRRLVRLVPVFAAVSLAAVAVVQLAIFHDASSAFKNRWQEASDSEGGLQDVLEKRVLGVFTDGLQFEGNTNWLGKGIGMGSNVAAVLTTGTPDFLLAEMEWARVVLEFGPIFGLSFMIFRVSLGARLVISSFRSMRHDESLGWMLVPVSVPLLVMTAMEQPTYLGFMVFGAGLCLAAGRQCPTFSRQSNLPLPSLP